MSRLWDPGTTPDFSPHEFVCNCGNCDGTAYMAQDFMEALQRMRNILGEVMTVVDGGGYRCSQHEDRVRRPGTRHVGFAADIQVLDGAHRMRLVTAALQAGMTGFGFGNSFLHVDVRDGVLVGWTY